MKGAQNREDQRAPTANGVSKRPSTEIVFTKVRRGINNRSNASRRINCRHRTPIAFINVNRRTHLMNRSLSAVSPRVKAAKLLWQNAAQKGRRSPGSNGRFESG